MRGFIILCLASVAIAAPQGYNYNPVGVQQSSGFQSQGFNSFGSSGSGLTASSGSSSFFQGAQQPQQQQAFVSQGHQQLQQQQQHHHQQQQAVISKRFYIHSAPEENDDDYKERHITVGVPRKNYNVVFIKSPSRGNKKASIKISPAVNEDKTVIYVLSKKTDSSDIQAEVIENVAPTTKPEVFFIKYKTNEEAAHAQEQIQAQYDALGGSSQVSDEGIAPVTSVIGSLGGEAAGAVASHSGQGAAHSGSIGGGVVATGSFNGGVGQHGSSGLSHATNNAYLPPSY